MFHPDDATFVELDATAFDCIVRVCARHEEPRSSEEEQLVKQLLSELQRSDLEFRVFDHSLPGQQPVPGILSAPTLVDFQITDRCGLGCPQCYASSVPGGEGVPWEDAVFAMRQLQDAGVCQVALGGGEPIQYPHLVDLLALISDHGMVPNMTTTGVGMTSSQLAAIRQHCGAVAMSLEAAGERFALRRRQGFVHFQKTAHRFLDAGVPLVLQVTVSAGNLVDLPQLLDFCLSLDSLYGVIFLAYKPAGRGTTFDAPLASQSYLDLKRALEPVISALRAQTRVGFDCCFTPGVAGMEADLGYAPGTILEGCSATRSGIGLTPTLDVLPCTFTPHLRLGNLKQHSLLELWRDYALDFRNAMSAHQQVKSKCSGCSVNSMCLGGCSVWSLVGCHRDPSGLDQISQTTELTV